ncbi:MAG TPA: hypothetical protein DCR93_03800 [Cytophagales bacterium]|nr:hypothetical protein [Cytophagales bacterium]
MFYAPISTNQIQVEDFFKVWSNGEVDRVLDSLSLKKVMNRKEKFLDILQKTNFATDNWEFSLHSEYVSIDLKDQHFPKKIRFQIQDNGDEILISGILSLIRHVFLENKIQKKLGWELDEMFTFYSANFKTDGSTLLHRELNKNNIYIPFRMMRVI